MTNPHLNNQPRGIQMLISRLTPRYVLLSLCILALSPQATLAQTHAAKDTLWAKAVAIAEANESWMPSQWQETEIVFNKKGKVEETTADSTGA